MRRWKILLLAALSMVLCGIFVTMMRPPGSLSSTLGQDLPWQVRANPDGTTLSVFGLTLGASTVQDAVNKLGQRYDLGLFQGQEGVLKLEAYFRDARIGGLNARLVLSARLPEATLTAIQSRAGDGKPTTDGGRHYPIAESDHPLALTAVLTAITFMPVATFDADLVRQRFGEPVEQIAAVGGSHWLYPAWGLDLLLGDTGRALLQYVPPVEFEPRLRAPLLEKPL